MGTVHGYICVNIFYSKFVKLKFDKTRIWLGEIGIKLLYQYCINESKHDGDNTTLQGNSDCEAIISFGTKFQLSIDLTIIERDIVFGIYLFRDFSKIWSSRQTLPGNWLNSLLYSILVS